jgi:hypothetical protein
LDYSFRFDAFALVAIGEVHEEVLKAIAALCTLLFGVGFNACPGGRGGGGEPMGYSLGNRSLFINIAGL